MPVIWGFDLSEMKWNAFASKKMFDPKWHLRKERFIIYQIAMLTSLAAECCATYSLSKYNFQESNIEEASGDTMVVFNNDIYASSCVTIVFCVLVATLFGTDFFFLLFFPKRRYPGWYQRSKKALAVGITMGMMAASIMSTIVISTHESYIEGPDPAEIERLANIYDHPPFVYRRWPTNIAWLVLLWIAFVSTVASTILMFIASSHDKKHGTDPYPRSTSSDSYNPESPSLQSDKRLYGHHHPNGVINGKEIDGTNGSAYPNGTEVDGTNGSAETVGTPAWASESTSVRPSGGGGEKV